MKPSQVVKIVLAGTVGTSAMTIYSYLVSSARNKNFREPALLAEMIQKINPSIRKSDAQTIGWIVHYGVGVFFASVYHYLLKHKTGNVKTGAIVGGITGMAGVSIWQLLFLLHPRPPQTDYTKFYGQLMIGHIIFGIVTCLFLGDELNAR
jgi:hypothetical protein